MPDIIHTQDYVVARCLQRAISHPHSAFRVPRSLVLLFSNVTDEPPATLAGLPYLQHASQPDYDAAITDPMLNKEPPPFRSSAVRLFGCSAVPRHFLVPSFVDTTHFAPATPEQKAAHRRQHGIPEAAFVIGCVAALQRHHKRLDSLIDEVAALSQAVGSDAAPRTLTHLSRRSVAACPSSGGKPDTLTRQSSPPHLVLAGATTDDTPFIEHYAQTHLGPNITILKDQPHTTMPAIYQCMDLYVHPAPEEVFGICLLESMACGIPVIAHHTPRMQYVVGKGGWLTDVTKPGFLGECLEKIQPQLPDASLRCRQHVESSFSWPAVYSQYMGMYREAMRSDTAKKTGS